MGQIIGSAAKPKRCNLNKLSQLVTPAAGEYILVSSDNSMNAAGQGNFDCYIVGDGRKAATALELKSIASAIVSMGDKNSVTGGAVYTELFDVRLNFGDIDIVNDIELHQGYIEKTGLMKAYATWYYGVVFLRAGWTITISNTNIGAYPSLGIAANGNVSIGDYVTVLTGKTYTADADTWIVVSAGTHLNSAVIHSDGGTFVGTDGTNAGKAGVVPAPSASQKGFFLSANGGFERNDGYLFNDVVSVNTNAQRSVDYTIPAGTKIAIRVSVVAGTSDIFTLRWIKAGGNVIIESNLVMGYTTGVLEVPSDSTGVNVFMNPAATGNQNRIEIYDVSKIDYVSSKIENIGGLAYLNNKQVISIDTTASVSSSAQIILSPQNADVYKLSGQLYAYIESDAEFATNGYIRFTASDNSLYDVTRLDLRDRKLFKIFAGKTLYQVHIAANAIATSGNVRIKIFSIDTSTEMETHALYGKKIMCFGDSITEFKNASNNKRYSDYLAEFSLASVANAGIGGTRLSQRLTPTLSPANNQQCVAAFEISSLVEAWCSGDYSYQDAALSAGYLDSTQQTLFAEKLAVLRANPVSDADIVTIFGGTNDYTGGVNIGTESVENTDKSTIVGAINSILHTLYTAKPALRVYVFTPIIRMFNQSVSYATSSDVMIPTGAAGGLTLPSLCEKIAEAASRNHAPVCDWYWNLGFNVQNWSTFFGTDYTHPYAGFYNIAERMYKFILSE